MLAILALRANIVFPAFVSIRLLIFHSLEYFFLYGEFSGTLQCHQCRSNTQQPHMFEKMCLAHTTHGCFMHNKYR